MTKWYMALGAAGVAVLLIGAVLVLSKVYMAKK